jgi:hypothetical protein
LLSDTTFHHILPCSQRNATVPRHCSLYLDTGFIVPPPLSNSCHWIIIFCVPLTTSRCIETCHNFFSAPTFFCNFDAMPFDKFLQRLLRHPALPLPTSELATSHFHIQWKSPIEDQCPGMTEEYTHHHVSLFRFQCLAFLLLKFVSTGNAMHIILGVGRLAYHANTLIFFLLHPGPIRTIYHQLLG